MTRAERQAQTREHLLRAGAGIFVARGFERASIEEIASSAGVTTGAIYSNFAGKADLFLALFEQQVQERVHELAGGATAGAEAWMRLLREEPHLYALFLEFCAHAARRPELRARLAEVFGTYREAVAALVESGAASHGIAVSPGAANRLAAAVVALGNGVAVERLAVPEAVPDDLYRWALELLMDGFAGRAGTDEANAR